MATPITLGKLIAKLEQSPQDNYLLFDFDGFAPKAVHSYRGRYEHEQLAIGFARNLDLKVGDFLPTLSAAIEKVYTSHNGNKDRVHPDTPVWVSNDGPSDNTVISDVLNIGRLTVLLTALYDTQPRRSITASHIAPTAAINLLSTLHRLEWLHQLNESESILLSL